MAEDLGVGEDLLDGVDDGLGPVQPPDRGRVQRREERQVRVEVVVLPQELHHLHELEDQPLPLLRVVFLQDSRPGNYFIKLSFIRLDSDGPPLRTCTRNSWH